MPPPTPKPSTTSRTGQGGCKPAYGTLDRTPGEGNLVGNQPEGCTRIFRRRDDGCPATAGGGRLNTQKRT